MKSFLRRGRDYTRYIFWNLKGRPIPVNHVFKRKRLIRIGHEYGCETFVETGTFYGQMVEAVRKHFKLILSVELYPPLFEYNRQRFARYPHIHLQQGDSTAALPEMVQQIQGRAIFWLDGHYSGAGTARGDQECPVLGELAAIGEHKRHDHCILIDDARSFTGACDYPSLQVVEERLRDINPGYNIFVDHDCIVALPQSEQYA